MKDEEAVRKEREKGLSALEKTLGYKFIDRSLLELALTHSSLRDTWTESNERLEFLGDSVIGLTVSEHLFCTRPDDPEGELTRLKSILVAGTSLAEVGKALELKKILRVGKGIRKSRSIPSSLIANAVEALVGAVYLDAGFEKARIVVLRHMDTLLTKVTRRRDERNHKAALQQMSQKRFSMTPNYEILETVGPDHKKQFVIEAVIGDRNFGAARGTTKKQAEQRAARLALRALKQENDSESG